MITSLQIERHVAEMIRESGSIVRPDLLAAFERALETERSERGRSVLQLLIDNARVAGEEDVPICQDTGTVWVRVEMGEDTHLEGDLQAAADRAVESAYREGGLRMSTVRDALTDRSNPDTNRPAFVELVRRPGAGATVSVMLKGAGSDNASRLEMLNPDEGFAGVKRVLLDVVNKKGSVACPPMVIGVGVGSTFDRVAGLAKHALMRSIGTPNPNPELDALERELLAAVNDTGVGPAGLGGDTTALAVHLESAPCHIAALPLAINLGCSAMRWRTRELDDSGSEVVAGDR